MEKTFDINPLVRIMEQLRDKENGCEWDKVQTFKSIAPYTIEEAYEVSEAINRGDKVELAEELGDLLLQVIFHSQMADEEGSFDLQTVINNICNKMIRRHPHIFEGDNSSNEMEVVQKNWETIKETERLEKGQHKSALDGVAIALPALKRAQKIQKRAARTGFDWPNSKGAKAKILEELEEIEGATSEIESIEEVGDLLFSVVNYARHLKVEPEEALQQATHKFTVRFQLMENLSGSDVSKFKTLSLEEKEVLWNRVKSQT